MIGDEQAELNLAGLREQCISEKAERIISGAIIVDKKEE